MDPSESWRNRPVSADFPELRTISELCARGDLHSVIKLFKNEELRNPDCLKAGLLGAITTRQIQIARQLLEYGANICEDAASGAAGAKSIPIFELFVEYGWDVNFSVGFGGTILPLVVEDEDLVRWALGNGVDPNRGSSLYPNVAIPYVTDSGSALNSAGRQGSVTVLNLLLDYGAELSNSIALHRAAESTHERRIPVMEHLIRLGMDINGWDDKMGQWSIGTPIVYAVKGGVVDNIQFLLENGADPLLKNRTGDVGRTVMEVIEEIGSAETVELVKQTCAKQG